MFEKIETPSNKKFGILFFIVFILIAFWPILKDGDIRIWSLIVSVIFLVLGLLNSKLLNPLNKAWMGFGLILGAIISPLVMGVIFFGIVTPTGILIRLFKKDLLKLKKNNNKTYWETKDNTNNNMKNQF